MWASCPGPMLVVGGTEGRQREGLPTCSEMAGLGGRLAGQHSALGFRVALQVAEEERAEQARCVEQPVLLAQGGTAGSTAAQACPLCSVRQRPGPFFLKWGSDWFSHLPAALHASQCPPVKARGLGLASLHSVCLAHPSFFYHLGTLRYPSKPSPTFPTSP